MSRAFIYISFLRTTNRMVVRTVRPNWKVALTAQYYCSGVKYSTSVIDLRQDPGPWIRDDPNSVGFLYSITTGYSSRACSELKSVGRE